MREMIDSLSKVSKETVKINKAGAEEPVVRQMKESELDKKIEDMENTASELVGMADKFIEINGSTEKTAGNVGNDSSDDGADNGSDDSSGDNSKYAAAEDSGDDCAKCHSLAGDNLRNDNLRSAESEKDIIGRSGIAPENEIERDRKDINDNNAIQKSGNTAGQNKAKQTCRAVEKLQ